MPPVKPNFYMVMRRCEGGFGYRDIFQAFSREETIEAYVRKYGLSQVEQTQFLVVDLGPQRDPDVYGGAAIYEAGYDIKRVI